MKAPSPDRTPRERLLARLTGPAEVVIDVGLWAAAAWVAVYLRYDLDVPPNEGRKLLRFLPIVAATRLLVGLAVGLYRRRWRYGSFDEVAALALTSLVTTGALALIDTSYLDPRLVPISAVWFAGFVGLVLMFGVRYTFRLVLERRLRPGADALRTVVFGAGDGGVQVINAMRKTPTSPYRPVAILDDDPTKRRLSIHGVRVVGSSEDLADVARRVRAAALLIAVPSADGELVKRLTSVAEDVGMVVKILPPVQELLSASPGISDIRDLTEVDLLGRHQIELDLEAISGYLNGRRVLVTGAGGSIGSELCRQIARFGVSELMMLDRDESNLHETQLSIRGTAFLDTPDVILADLRDAASIRAVFETRRPQVVFHAAALKHLPMLEQYPAEAAKANVWGTLTVLEAARAVGVERFVNISTDKAANPTSMLGYSKRIAERLTAAMARQAKGTYLSVRFGNVLGSRGSVLTTFREQINKGGPVTVTHPDITRFFMTIPEAVQLVVQAGAIGGPGEVLVLDMGKPVRILDVARLMIARAGKPIRIEYAHLRPGEKMHEELFGDGEIDTRPKHPLVSHAPVPPLDPVRVKADIDDWDPDEIRAWLTDLAQS